MQGTNARVTWTTVSNHSYEVQWRRLENLNFTNWEVFSPVIPALATGTTNYAGYTEPTKASGFRVADIPFDCSLGATDDASQSPYTFGPSGWPNLSNGGQGFQPWVLTSFGGLGGFFIGDSSKNSLDGSGHSGNINTGAGLKNSWGMWASKGTTNEVLRQFQCPLTTNDTLKLDMDNGLVVIPGKVGFSLRSGNSIRFQFYCTGGQPNYQIDESSGTQINTTIPVTADGLHLVFTVLDNANHYGLSGPGWAISGGTLSGTGPIDRIVLFDYGAGGSGSDQPNDVYFNSLQIVR